MMFTCENCGFHTPNFTKLVTHYKRSQICEIFFHMACVEEGCPRSYTSIESWLKHIRTKHPICQRESLPVTQVVQPSSGSNVILIDANIGDNDIKTEEVENIDHDLDKTIGYQLQYKAPVFHVSWGQSKKKVVASELKSVSDFKKKVEEKFMSKLVNKLMQYYDGDCQDWVDMDMDGWNDVVCSNKVTKVRVMSCSSDKSSQKTTDPEPNVLLPIPQTETCNSPKHEPELEISLLSQSQSSATELNMEAVEVAQPEVTSFLSESQSSTPQFDAEAIDTAPPKIPTMESWKYSVPSENMSLRVLHQLENNLPNGPTCSVVENITDAFFFKWSKHDIFYPNHFDYILMAQCLVEKYPCLATPSVPGAGYESAVHIWKNRLQYKFQNERKKLTGVESVERRRGNKRKGSSEFTKTHKAMWALRHYLPDRPEGEDDVSMIHMQHMLMLECEKAEPDMCTVSTLMDRTLSERRKMLIEQQADVEMMIREWPALKLKDGITDEFRRVSGRDIILDIRNAIKKYGNKLCFMSRKSKNSVVQEIWTKLDFGGSGTDKKPYFDAAALLAIPGQMKETVGKLLFKDEEMDTTAGIRYRDDPAKGPFDVFMENIKLSTCSDLPHAMAVYMASHYVFNIPYDKRMQKTCLFIQKIFCHISDEQNTYSKCAAINGLAAMISV